MTKPAVEVLQITVYRGGGRRWFRKASAYHAAARAIIKAKCRGMHSPYDDHPYGEGTAREYHYCHLCETTCRHGHMEAMASHYKEPCQNPKCTYGAFVTKRLARWLRWRDAKEASYSACADMAKHAVEISAYDRGVTEHDCGDDVAAANPESSDGSEG